MADSRSTWLRTARAWLVISALVGCAGGGEHDVAAAFVEPNASDGSLPIAAQPIDAAAAVDATMSLELADGGKILYRDVSCTYRKDTPCCSSNLQLQFRGEPDSGALFVYIRDPVPAKPFVATPRDVNEFEFWAGSGQQGYSAKLQNAEVTLRLDDLPAHMSPKEQKFVHLHGTLEISAFDLPATPIGWAPALSLAPATLAVACETRLEFSEVVW